MTGLALFVLFTAIILVVYRGVEETRTRENLTHLKAQAAYAASLIDTRAHAWLTDVSQTSSQAQQTLTERLQKLRDHDPALSRLFTGRFQNDSLMAILDTYDPTGGSGGRQLIGRPLDPPIDPASAEYKAISTGATISNVRKGDLDETYISVIVPLENPNIKARDFLFLETRIPPSTDGTMRDVAIFLAAVLSSVMAAMILSWKSKGYFQQAMTMTALRENEELFRSTYELSPVGMCLTEINGQVLRANKAFCQFTGYTETELRAMEPERLVHPGDLAREQPLIDSIVQLQASQYTTERRYLHKDGQLRWGLVSVAIVRDSDANISHYMAQVVDISERKLSEEVVRLNEERLTLAAEAGHVGTWDHDIHSNTLVWNSVMHVIYQTDAAAFEPTFEKQFAFIHEEDRPRVEQEYRKCLQTGCPYEQEYRICVDDSLRHVKASAVIFRDDRGRPVRAVGANIDITSEKEESEDLKRAKEAALAADKAKSEFLAVMSHEIRTPLNGVLGFVSMLKNTPLDSEQLSYIETMEMSGQGLLTLVNDILDLSKIESHEIHVENSTFELRPFVRRIHQQLQAHALSRELEYDYFVEYSVPKTIHTDQIRLGQILTNLLGNALKFTEAGSVDLHVSARAIGLFQKNWEWKFTISDTGPGIPAEALPNLFKLFYQVDSSATRKHGGTGLGLAISQRLSRLLGGDIEVRSQHGEGSQFIITITAPRGEPSPLPGQTIPGKAMEDTASGMRGKRILVVEDNPVNRKLCALQLKRLGCETDFAESGSEAVEKVRQHTFDAVLMDMQLPDLDGCDATRMIRREVSGGENLSIIALTANAMPEDRRKCLEAGMDDFLSKPLQYEKLATTLSKWV